MSLHKRIKKINNVESQKGDCVVYVMSRDQRVRDNHALLAAQKHAKSLELSLIVVFNLYKKENVLKNIYKWMIEGLKKIEKDLTNLNIPFYIFEKDFTENLKNLNPSVFYFDFSPLNGPKKFVKHISEELKIPAYVVDTHNIVPVWTSSDKEEYAVRFLRPKIQKHLSEFLAEPESLKAQKQISKFRIQKIDWGKIYNSVILEEMEGYNPIVKSGEDEALNVLKYFLEEKLDNYDELRNDPTKDFQSNLSAYLHFGQISSLRVILELRNFVAKNPSQKLKKSAEAFENEIIYWKEMADNFCNYNPNYNNLNGAKDWAQNTLQSHRKDKRDYTYTLKELEQAKTHDKAWNAAQLEMTKTGKMHGYMRMYWAKKILEWTESPDKAVEYAIYLNDKYELDGRDPNGYLGIMWSICGIADRPWFEREVFGQIRYMNYEGLKRKFDVEWYVEKFHSLK